MARRAEEWSVIADSDLDHMWFPLGEHLLPKELLSTILSFLRYDRWILVQLGLVNWEWYQLVLSTWPSIRVTKNNVGQIPVTVLQAVHTLRLDEGPSARAENRLSTEEFRSLFMIVGRENLRSLEILRPSVAGLAELTSCLLSLHRDGFLSSLLRLSFLGGIVHQRYLREIAPSRASRRSRKACMSALKQLRIRRFAPDVEEVSGVSVLFWCDRLMSLRVLRAQFLEDVRFCDFERVSLPCLEHLAIQFGKKVAVNGKLAVWISSVVARNHLLVLELRDTPAAVFGALTQLERTATSRLQKLCLCLRANDSFSETLSLDFRNCRHVVFEGMADRTLVGLALNAFGESLAYLGLSCRKDKGEPCTPDDAERLISRVSSLRKARFDLSFGLLHFSSVPSIVRFVHSWSIIRETLECRILQFILSAFEFSKCQYFEILIEAAPGNQEPYEQILNTKFFGRKVIGFVKKRERWYHPTYKAVSKQHRPPIGREKIPSSFWPPNSKIIQFINDAFVTVVTREDINIAERPYRAYAHRRRFRYQPPVSSEHCFKFLFK